MTAGDLVLAAAAGLHGLGAAAAAMAPPDPVTITIPGASDRRCGRIAYIEANGPGGKPWAWVNVGDRAPIWLAHVPLAELTAGCAP